MDVREANGQETIHRTKKKKKSNDKTSAALDAYCVYLPIHLGKIKSLISHILKRYSVHLVRRSVLYYIVLRENT